MNPKIALLVFLMSAMTVCCHAACRDGGPGNGLPERQKENGGLWGKAGVGNFLIIDGCARLIPSWTMYDNVFKSRTCIHEDVNIDSYCICVGEDLDETTQIGHFGDWPGNFLWTGGHIHWIPSNAAADKYCFNLNMLQEWKKEDKATLPEGKHLYPGQ